MEVEVVVSRPSPRASVGCGRDLPTRQSGSRRSAISRSDTGGWAVKLKGWLSGWRQRIKIMLNIVGCTESVSLRRAAMVAG